LRVTGGSFSLRDPQSEIRHDLESFAMRHGVAGRKLGRNASQRKALWRGLITELFRHERINTTEAKARSMRGDAEHLITVAKHGLAEGGNNVHAHRLAAQVITDPEVTKRLFSEIAPRFTERPGGYTRIVKVGPRFGDGAEMVILELVEKGTAVTEDKNAKDAKAKSKVKGAKAKDTKAKDTKAKDTKAKDAKETKAKK
jgi:large subunit ribosomal protein L17